MFFDLRGLKLLVSESEKNYLNKEMSDLKGDGYDLTGITKMNQLYKFRQEKLGRGDKTNSTITSCAQPISTTSVIVLPTTVKSTSVVANVSNDYEGASGGMEQLNNVNRTNNMGYQQTNQASYSQTLQHNPQHSVQQGQQHHARQTLNTGFRPQQSNQSNIRPQYAQNNYRPSVNQSNASRQSSQAYAPVQPSQQYVRQQRPQAQQTVQSNQGDQTAFVPRQQDSGTATDQYGNLLPAKYIFDPNLCKRMGSNAMGYHGDSRTRYGYDPNLKCYGCGHAGFIIRMCPYCTPQDEIDIWQNTSGIERNRLLAELRQNKQWKPIPTASSQDSRMNVNSATATGNEIWGDVQEY